MAHTDSKVVDAFRRHLSERSGRKFRLIDRPDKRDRMGKACDAIFERSGHKYAVEHSSIDSFVDQRRDDDRFTKVLVSVEEALKVEFKGSVEFSVPVHSIPTRADWHDISCKIVTWCRANVARIPDSVWTPVSIPGVPFSAAILKDSRLDLGFYVSRTAPVDLETQRLVVIKTALETRGTKLLRYKEQGHRTTLLLECQDIALGNPRLIGEAVTAGMAEMRLTEGVDDVFLVITRFEPFSFFCLKLDVTPWPESWGKWQGYSL